MGAFDHLSDNDPISIAHEEGKLHSDCGRKLNEYSLEELQNEVKRREKIEKEKESRYKLYLELKKEFNEK